MKNIFTCLILLNLFPVVIQAQGISGVVRDHEEKAMEYVMVSLLKSKDSTIIKMEMTNEKGAYQFKQLPAGDYMIKGTNLGYQPVFTSVFNWNNMDLKIPDLKFSKTKGIQLNGVEVIYNKPLVEASGDKTIVHVEGTVNAIGQDAIELLRKSPGVMVDKDDNIVFSGKTGVQIYIDGRVMPLTGKDLSDYLRTIQSSQIENIELISNPSAKYEAAGNAGIINIRLKKNKNFGMNGTFNAGYNIGTYGKYNTGLSWNYRDKKFNFFTTYNYNHSLNIGHFNLYRIQLDTLFDQKSENLFKNNPHSIKAGADYFISKFSTLGVLINATFATFEVNNNSNTPIEYIPTHMVNRILVAENTTGAKRNNANVNFNYKYSDNKGHDFNMDADYGQYRISTNQYQPNYYYNAQQTELLNSVIYSMNAPTDIDIFSLKGDYEFNFLNGKLGLGGKWSNVHTDNDFRRYNVYTSEKSLDSLRSNQFIYDEQIQAGYLNFNKPFKDGSFQLGLRMENTYSEGNSKGLRPGNQRYDSLNVRQYFNLFPNVAFNFKPDKNNQYSISIGRRIDRPSYQSLNPFEFKLDEYTSQKGNTLLRPQYTNTIALTHVYKNKLTTKLSYSKVHDVFTQIVDTINRSAAFITQKNIASNDVIGLNISLPVQYKNYGAFINLNNFYTHYYANFGNGRIVDIDAFTVSLFAQQNLKLKHGVTLEISGMFNSPSVAQGTFKMQSIYGIDLGVQKTVLEGKGNIKMSITDIFQSQRFRGTSNFAGQYLHFYFASETRQLRLNFSYRFGNNQVKAARQRRSGTEDENKRVSGQGGVIGNN
ncbi:MAG: outer membrane beta-barrel family protein [Saprospiraceae bacterium]